MKILVTGSLGYIGAVMVPFLKQAGHQVDGMDTGYYASPEVLKASETIKQDIRNVKVDQLRGYDAIVHLAALSNDPMGELDQGLTDEINWKATVRLAEYAKQAGVKRFVFSSSCSMYGATKADAASEEDDLNPLTAYARSKVNAERDMRPLADDIFSPIFLRNGTAYGTSPALRFDLVLNNLVGSALTTGKIVILSDGSPWRPLVHIEDISRAVVAVLEAPREAVHNQAFNVGRPDGNYQVRDVALAVKKVLPDCEITFGSSQPNPDKRDYRVSFDKIMTVVSAFQPQWTLEKGAQQIVDFFHHQPLTEAEFRGPQFVRLERLKQLISDGSLTSKLFWK